MAASVDSRTFRLIVGLGNPGTEYRETRHNVGFMIVDRMAQSMQVTWRLEKTWRAEVVRTSSVCLCKPTTYMNLSGEAVAAVAKFYKIDPAEVLVVLDDMALPLGKLRLRTGGSAGGHNGLQSVIDHLGTSEIARLRVGIGSAEAGQASNHVLGRFALEERDILEQSLARATDAIDCAQARGFSVAMNLFNPSQPPPKSKE